MYFLQHAILNNGGGTHHASNNKEDTSDVWIDPKILAATLFLPSKVTLIRFSSKWVPHLTGCTDPRQRQKIYATNIAVVSSLFESGYFRLYVSDFLSTISMMTF